MTLILDLSGKLDSDVDHQTCERGDLGLHLIASSHGGRTYGGTLGPRRLPFSYLSKGSINPLDSQLASNVIDACGHATSNSRVGNPFFRADILDFPVISIESNVDGLSLFRR